VSLKDHQIASPNCSSIGPKWRVLIAHPGRQHSAQAALALHGARYLACYATGIPVSKRQFGQRSQRLIAKYSVYEEVDIPLQLVRLNMVAPIVNRLLVRNLPEHIGGPVLYETHRMFDWWVARLIERQGFDAVVAYENSALHSFRAARKIGAACILDAAGLHRIEADYRYRVRLPHAYKRGVDVRKDMEVALADCIFTTSDLAAQSYLANVPKNVRVRPIALGADIDRFKPVPDSVGAKAEWKPFTFVFVGRATRLKGFDLLIKAVEQLLGERLDFKMVVAGNLDESLFWGRRSTRHAIEAHGMIGHEDLVSVLRNAHCLVLPSRLDSFGLVVPEAMGCGLPVIVSDMVGAKQLVTDGQNGFIVPTESVEALADRMRWLIRNRKAFKHMSVAARAAAEEASWEKYRRRFVTAIEEVLLGR
jgi:glycosyltransferase involved in cell wall biosynthesis